MTAVQWLCNIFVCLLMLFIVLEIFIVIFKVVIIGALLLWAVLNI